MNDIRCYSELIQIPTFKERFKYLATESVIGEDTFGMDRWINQIFYKSKEWLSVRAFVINRDNGYDLGAFDRKIPDGELVVVHHIIQITRDDILNKNPIIVDPEFLISASDRTHKALHFGSYELLNTFDYIERKPNDTCPWRC